MVGLGLDLVDVARIRELLERHGERFRERTFTAREIAYCDACADPAIHYAARFAAKEAGAKALGTGFSEGVNWTDIEVLRADNGAPSLILHGGALEIARGKNVVTMLVTLTHTRHAAAAQVVLA